MPTLRGVDHDEIRRALDDVRSDIAVVYGGEIRRWLYEHRSRVAFALRDLSDDALLRASEGGPIPEDLGE